jgi:hypothetical protein
MYGVTMKSHGYCLYCFHQELNEHSRCLECGRSSLPAQRAEFWNQHPNLMRTERGYKSLIAAAGAAGTLACCVAMGASSGPGSGWIILLPTAFAVGAWKTAGKWTRHLPYFSARVVWSAAFVLCGFVFGALIAASGGGTGESWAWAAGFLAAGIGFAYLVRLVCARCEAWKQDLMHGEPIEED